MNRKRHVEVSIFGIVFCLVTMVFSGSLSVAAAAAAAADEGEQAKPSPWIEVSAQISREYYRKNHKGDAMSLLRDALEVHGSDVPEEKLEGTLGMLGEYYGVVKPAQVDRFREVLLRLFRERSVARIDRIVEFFRGSEGGLLYEVASGARRDYFTPHSASFQLEDQYVRLSIGEERRIRVNAWNADDVALPSLEHLIVVSQDPEAVVLNTESMAKHGFVLVSALRSGKTKIVLANGQSQELGTATIDVRTELTLSVDPATVTMKEGESKIFVVGSNRPISDLPSVTVRPSVDGFVQTDLFEPPPASMEQHFRVTALRATDGHSPLKIEIFASEAVGKIVAATHTMVTIEAAPLSVEPATADLKVGETQEFVLIANRPFLEFGNRPVIRPERDGVIRLEVSDPPPNAKRLTFRVTAIQATEPLVPLRLNVFVKDRELGEVGFGAPETYTDLTIRPILREPSKKWPLLVSTLAVSGAVLGAAAQSAADESRREERVAARAGDARSAEKHYADYSDSQSSAVAYWSAAGVAAATGTILWLRYRSSRKEYERAQEKYFGLYLDLDQRVAVGARVRF